MDTKLLPFFWEALPDRQSPLPSDPSLHVAAGSAPKSSFCTPEPPGGGTLSDTSSNHVMKALNLALLVGKEDHGVPQESDICWGLDQQYKPQFLR